MTNEWISRLITRELATFSRELELFPDEALIWATAPGIANSAGTLTLHVCGNLQHFVGAVLGNSGYVRDRPLEFSARDLPRAVLRENLARTSEVVRMVLADLTDQSSRPTIRTVSACRACRPVSFFTSSPLISRFTWARRAISGGC